MDKTTGFVRYTEHEHVSYLWWYHLIGLIWTSEFIIACQQLVVSGAVATWYFTRDKKNLSCTICKSTKLLIFHHLGSVAFGAFIITLVKLPRWILMYMQKKNKGFPEHLCPVRNEVLYLLFVVPRKVLEISEPECLYCSSNSRYKLLFLS